MKLRIAIGDYGLRSGHVSVGADFAKGVMHLYTLVHGPGPFWIRVGWPNWNAICARGLSLEIDIHASFPSPWFGARAYMNGGSAALVIVHSVGLWD